MAGGQAPLGRPGFHKGPPSSSVSDPQPPGLLLGLRPAILLRNRNQLCSLHRFSLLGSYFCCETLGGPPSEWEVSSPLRPAGLAPTLRTFYLNGSIVCVLGGETICSFSCWKHPEV